MESESYTKNRKYTPANIIFVEQILKKSNNLTIIENLKMFFSIRYWILDPILFEEVNFWVMYVNLRKFLCKHWNIINFIFL